MLTLSSCKANKVAIASSGALQHLAEFVNSGDIQLQLDVVATIHNLSTCEEIVPLIVASGIILSLLELVHNSVKSSPLGEKAIGLLENIVSSSESALCEAASVGGAIRILREIQRFDSERGSDARTASVKHRWNAESQEHGSRTVVASEGLLRL
ncbi:hypothetical protein AHAS_Ahas05G0195900 [Arachis hypogaea]